MSVKQLQQRLAFVLPLLVALLLPAANARQPAWAVTAGSPQQQEQGAPGGRALSRNGLRQGPGGYTFGQATWYDGILAGACGFFEDIPSNGFVGAWPYIETGPPGSGEGFWQPGGGADACGRCFEVSCVPQVVESADGTIFLDRTDACRDESLAVIIQVVDECRCSGAGLPLQQRGNFNWCCNVPTPRQRYDRHIDLSRQAFTELVVNGNFNLGILGIRWRPASCDFIGLVRINSDGSTTPIGSGGGSAPTPTPAPSAPSPAPEPTPVPPSIPEPSEPSLPAPPPTPPPPPSPEPSEPSQPAPSPSPRPTEPSRPTPPAPPPTSPTPQPTEPSRPAPPPTPAPSSSPRPSEPSRPASPPTPPTSPMPPSPQPSKPSLPAGPAPGVPPLKPVSPPGSPKPSPAPPTSRPPSTQAARPTTPLPNQNPTKPTPQKNPKPHKEVSADYDNDYATISGKHVSASHNTCCKSVAVMMEYEKSKLADPEVDVLVSYYPLTYYLPYVAYYPAQQSSPPSHVGGDYDEDVGDYEGDYKGDYLVVSKQPEPGKPAKSEAMAGDHHVLLSKPSKPEKGKPEKGELEKHEKPEKKKKEKPEKPDQAPSHGKVKLEKSDSEKEDAWKPEKVKYEKQKP